MWELGVDSGSGEVNPGLCKQMLQKNACRIIQIAESKPNEYVWQQVNILAGCPDFCCQPASVASYHDSAMSVLVIRCQRSCYKEQWMAVVAEENLVFHGRTT